MTIQTLNVTIGCGLVQLSKSNKNIGARWRVDNLFETADLGDILAHPRITSLYERQHR